MVCLDNQGKRGRLFYFLSLYHSMVFFNPSSKEVMALKPNSFSAFDVSCILRGWPSGLSGLSSLSGFSRLSRLFGLSGRFGLFRLER